jgi:RNA recognition motif-containing protein
MQTNNGKNIFSNALKDIKKSKTQGNTKPRPVTKTQQDEDMIDFDEEMKTLGEDIHTENFSNKIKSAVIKTSNTPFPVSSVGSDKTAPIKIIKTDGNIKIIISNKGKHNVQKADQWKHDLFNEMPSKSYIVFIRNLSHLMTETKLKEIYSQYGNIVSAKIDRGTAEIKYTRKDMAMKAIESTNGKEFFGKVIKASYYEDDEANNKKIERSGSRVNVSREKRDSIWNRIKLNN